jgi:hypothetical protein
MVGGFLHATKATECDSALAALPEEFRDVTEEYQWYLGEDAER